MGSAIFFDLVKDKTIDGFHPDNVVTLMTSPPFATLVPVASGANKRIRGKYGVSLLYADNRIYASSKQGKTTVIEPGRAFRQLAVNKFDGDFCASRAVAG